MDKRKTAVSKEKREKQQEQCTQVEDKNRSLRFQTNEADYQGKHSGTNSRNERQGIHPPTKFYNFKLIKKKRNPNFLCKRFFPPSAFLVFSLFSGTGGLESKRAIRRLRREKMFKKGTNA